MEQLHLFKTEKIPIVVAYGMGVDSTTALIGLARRGIRPDLILFADTGGEKRETYDYKPVFQDWLDREGFPTIVTVRYKPVNFKNWPPYHTLEENCLTNGTLPSLAFGFKSCSLKWKVCPQDKFVQQWDVAREVWSNGQKVIKVIGYDAGPTDMRRRNHAGNASDPRYDYQYPLIEWEWDRERCKEEIRRAGLKVPCKSACFFCPATKPEEIDKFPSDLLRRIIRMEARAQPRLIKVEGLWRKSTRTRPGSITQYIAAKNLLPAEEIVDLLETTNREIIEFQEGYATALASGRGSEFLANAREGEDRRHPASSPVAHS